MCVHYIHTYVDMNSTSTRCPHSPFSHKWSISISQTWRSKLWVCSAVVKPISRTNGGLTALCALWEEEQPPAIGQAEKARGQGDGRGQHRLEVGSSCGLWETPFKWLLKYMDLFTAWVWFHTSETGGKEKIACTNSCWFEKKCQGYWMGRLW